MSANDKQVGGEHYKADYQHWDFMADIYGQSYFKAQITRYVSRWRKKNGLQDLKKAVHYSEKLYELVYGGMHISQQVSSELVNKYFDANLPDLKDLQLMAFALQAKSLKDVQKLTDELNELVATVSTSEV